jgi:hypothetical protein
MEQYFESGRRRDGDLDTLKAVACECYETLRCQAFLGTLLPDTKEYAITAVRPGGYAECKTKSSIFLE